MAIFNFVFSLKELEFLFKCDGGIHSEIIQDTDTKGNYPEIITSQE